MGVIFRPSDNGTLVVYDKTGASVLIDDNMIAPLQNWMRNNGPIYHDGDGFRQSRSPRAPLVKIIAELGYGLKPYYLLRHSIGTKGDRTDLRLCNISFKNRLAEADAFYCKTLHDNEFNTLYDMGTDLRLLLKDDGVVVKLDALNVMRQLLISLLKTGHIISKRPTQKHVFVTALNGAKSRLVAHVLAELYRVPVSSLVSKYVRYWNDDPLDLTRENLVSTSVSMARNQNRLIWISGGQVYVWLNNRLPHFTDNAAMMEPILKMPCWTWHTRADGRLSAIASSAGKCAGINETYLYQLRWAVAHFDATDDYFQLARALREMKEYFRSSNYVLDHLDSNYRNNNIWNLSCMTLTENTQKAGLTAKIYAPFFWFSVHIYNGYRIFYGDDMKSPSRVFCSESGTYIEILRRFYETGQGKSISPKQIPEGERIGYDKDGTLTGVGREIIRSLLTESEDLFTLYKNREELEQDGTKQTEHGKP